MIGKFAGSYYDGRVRRPLRALAFITGAVSGLLASLPGCSEDGAIAPIRGSGSFEPAELDFGLVPVGATRSLAATLRNAGAEDVTVRSIRFEPPVDAYAARLAGGGTLRGASLPRGARLEIVVLYAPLEARAHSTTMIAVFGAFEAELPIRAGGRPVLPPMPSVDPASITFLDVEIGRDAVERVSLTNTGEMDGALREIRPKSMSGSAPFAVTRDGGVAPVPTRPLAGGGADAISLEIHFLPRELGSFSEDLELVLDGGESFVLAVAGNGVPAGALTCDRASLDFGPVPRGMTARHDVHCVVSGGRYTLGSIGLSAGTSALFRLPNAPTMLLGASAFDFAVEFASLGLPEIYAGFIEIVAAHGAVTRIALSGEVVPPDPGNTDLSAVLTWDSDLTDFDVHLVRNGATPFDSDDDCYFAEKSPDWGVPNDTIDDPYLDRDETDGIGPEVVNLTVATEPFFDVYVHFYNYTSAAPPPTTVTVTYSIRGSPPRAVTQAMPVCGSAWHAGRFRFDVDPPVFEPDPAPPTDLWRSRAASRCQ